MSRYTKAELVAIMAAKLELNPFADADIRGRSGHVALRHETCSTDGICQVCDGGLFICTRCGSFEGATTTFCPGRRIHLTDEVYVGRLDYRAAAGCAGRWVGGPSTWTPALWSLACERAGIERGRR